MYLVCDGGCIGVYICKNLQTIQLEVHFSCKLYFILVLIRFILEKKEVILKCLV